MNKKGTGIPTLKNPDRYERFLNISESLNRKCKVIPTDSGYVPKSTSLAEKNKNTTERLNTELEKLNAEILQATDELRAIDDEYSHQNMLYRALKTEMAELNNVLRDHEAKFEYMLSQTTLKVELRQKELDVAIKEHKTALEDTYNNTQFELENELLKVNVFDDTEALTELKSLEEKKVQFQRQLQQQVEKNTDALLKIEQQNKEKLNKMESDSLKRIEDVMDGIVALEQTLSDAESRLSQAQNELKIQQQSEAELAKEIEIKRLQLNNFDAVEDDWQVQLQDINTKLRSLNNIDVQWSQKVNEAEILYQADKAKFEKYQNTRRSLEHALSLYGNNSRAFIKFSGDDFESDSERFGTKFDKFVSKVDAKEFAKEWELYVQQCCHGALVDLIFCGNEPNNCLTRITECLEFLFEGIKNHETENVKYDLFIQSVHIEQTRILDLLNRGKEVNIEMQGHAIDMNSQKMTLNGVGDIVTAFKNINLAGKATVHVITVSGTHISQNGKFMKHGYRRGTSKPIRAQLCLLELSHLLLEDQTRYICSLGENEDINVLVQHSYATKCLTVCGLSEMTSSDSQNLLEAIAKVTKVSPR